MAIAKQYSARLGFAFAFLLASVLAACDSTTPTVISGETMGTTWSIAISSHLSEQQLAALKEEAEKLLAEVNHSMSNWIEDSEISKVNRSRSSDWQPLSPQLAKVLAEAARVYEFSDGYFDITSEPLLRLWGFGPNAEVSSIPSDEDIKETLKRTGGDKLQIRLSPPSLRKVEPKLHLDLSAIAKGYGVDVLSEHLLARGIVDFIVEIGGDLRVSGNRPDGEAWRVGLEKPVVGKREVSLALALENSGVASSGGYRNYVTIGPTRYPHGMNPHNGRPIKHNTEMVTVIADNAMTADALATAFYVLGSEKGLILAEKENVAVAFFFAEEHSLEPVFSKAFKPYLAP